jgi:hypothetical protein
MTVFFADILTRKAVESKSLVKLVKEPVDLPFTSVNTSEQGKRSSTRSFQGSRSPISNSSKNSDSHSLMSFRSSNRNAKTMDSNSAFGFLEKVIEREKDEFQSIITKLVSH